MNWQQEQLKNDEEAKSAFWKAEEGRHRVTLKGEPKESSKDFGDGELKTRISIPIEEEGIGYVWSFNKSFGDKSIWGQLVRLGSFMQAESKELTGSTITVRVKGKGKDKSYDIDELYPYLEKAKKADKPAPQGAATSSSGDNSVEAFL